MQEEKDELLTVPVSVYERTVSRFERIIKCQFLIMALLIAVIALGFYEFCQYDVTGVTVDSEDGGSANYVGDHNYVGASGGAMINAEGGSKEASEKE